MNTQVPESFDGIADSELETLMAELTSEFDAKYEGDTPAPLAELTEIADAISAIKAEQTNRFEAAEAEAADRAALADRVRPAETETVEAEAVEVAEVETVEVVEVEEAEVVEEKELVTASTPAPSARAISNARTVTAPPADAKSDVVITAAADIPGVTNGSRLDRLGMAAAFNARARGLNNFSPRVGVASIHLDREFMVKDGGAPAHEVITAAVDSKLSGVNAKALVASGGWCTPSETVYDLFSIESRDGLIDLPTIGISRGGVQMPSFIGLDAVASALWTWTEANDETPGSDGDATKDCLQVPCPTWDDYRLEAEGMCITAGNFMDRSYPELIARTIDLAVTAHMHRVSNSTVAKIIASISAGNKVTVATAPSDAAGDILAAIDLQVADYRSQFLMGDNTVIDGLFPQWFKEAIRSTIAMRAGIESFTVSDAEIVGFLTARNVRPQFLAGYQALFDTNPATAFPATGKFILMPAGGYVIGDGGSIDLGVVRDSTLNATNDFTAAWSEQFFQLIQRGPEAREVTVTTDVTGVTGGPAFPSAVFGPPAP